MTLRTPPFISMSFQGSLAKLGASLFQGSGHHVASSWEKVLQSVLGNCSFFPAQELPPEGQKLGVGGGDLGKERAREREEVKTERREELSDSSCGFITPERWVQESHV